MASSYTRAGQTIALFGNSTPNGGIANLATKMKLMDSTSVPAKDGTGFVEIVGGNGYTTGGLTINRSDWTSALDGQNIKLTLATQSWTASGGPVPATGPDGISGAWIEDASGNVLAWMEVAFTTLISGDEIQMALSLELQ